MDLDIVWKPSKSDREQVAKLCIGMAVTKDYERVLIGTRDAIRNRLEGAETTDVVFDQIRPFGSFLLMLEYDAERKWNEALTHLREARDVLDRSNIGRAMSKDDPKAYEKEAMELLIDKYESDDLISRYVAMRMWYGYWLIRGTKDKDDLAVFEYEMDTLIRPFRVPSVLLEEGTDLTPEHPLFRYVEERGLSDRTSVVFNSLGKDRLECVIVDKSLLPIKKYYADRVMRWKKVVMKCKWCGQFFIANNRNCDYCSYECKGLARNQTLVERKTNKNTAEIDQLCGTANAYWANRRAKIRKSPEWTADEVRAFEIEMKKFQDEKVEMRKKHKKGEITLSELKNWLAEQSIRAEKTLESIKVTQR